jgi:hypothetical protein
MLLKDWGRSKLVIVKKLQIVKDMFQARNLEEDAPHVARVVMDRFIVVLADLNGCFRGLNHGDDSRHQAQGLGHLQKKFSNELGI